MTYKIYVDIPEDYDYKWHLTDIRITGKYHVNDVLSMEYNVPFKFICNNFGNISKGDVYEVEFANKKDVSFFLIKTGFDTIDKEKVDNYFMWSEGRRISSSVPPYVFANI